MDKKLDVSASYPNGSVSFNSSKETTVRELIDIEGVPEERFKMENMGISAGHVNAVTWCMNMLNFPDHLSALDAFLKMHPEAQLGVTFEEAKTDMHGENARFYRTPEMRIKPQ